MKSIEDILASKRLNSPKKSWNDYKHIRVILAGWLLNESFRVKVEGTTLTVSSQDPMAISHILMHKPKIITQLRETGSNINEIKTVLS